MKKIKKIAAGLMAVVAMATSVCGFSASASTTDIPINFTATVFGWTNPTDPALKDNTSSVYLYLKTGSNSVKVKTYGCTYTSPNYSWEDNLTLSNTGNPTTSVTCAIGTEYQIYNSIRETGYLYAGLKMQTKGFSSNTVTGAWSSDFAAVYGHTYVVAS